MKKELSIIVLMLIFIVLPINLKSQESFTSTSTSTSVSTPISFNIQGGYSWLTGVVGGEIQIGHIGLAGGWMPTTMPLSGTKVNSGCFAATYYTSTPSQDGYSLYLSGGVSTQGYQYEDTWGGEITLPTAIIMVGSKYETGGLYLKSGIGYGWCEEAGVFTFEITLGLKIFGN